MPSSESRPCSLVDATYVQERGERHVTCRPGHVARWLDLETRQSESLLTEYLAPPHRQGEYTTRDRILKLVCEDQVSSSHMTTFSFQAVSEASRQRAGFELTWRIVSMAAPCRICACESYTNCRPAGPERWGRYRCRVSASRKKGKEGGMQRWVRKACRGKADRCDGRNVLYVRPQWRPHLPASAPPPPPGPHANSTAAAATMLRR